MIPGWTSDKDITLPSRYECKYLIHPARVAEIREFIAPFMRPDRFAASREGFRYPICSLYLDSPDLALYQQTVNGEKNRFKLRIRSYGDDPETPVYLEVKRKVANIVQKRRARVARDEALGLLGRWRGTPPPGNASPFAADREYFAGHMDWISARPVVRVRYLREAYESAGGDPVRLTVDSRLMHAATLDEDLSHERGRWVSTPVEGSILEIKYTELAPSWIRDLVRVFELRQRAVPKYVMSVDHVLLEGRESVLGLGETILPVRRA